MPKKPTRSEDEKMAITMMVRMILSARPKMDIYRALKMAESVIDSK